MTSTCIYLELTCHSISRIIHIRLIWHLGQSFISAAIYFSSIVKPRSKPFLEPTSTGGNFSCSRRPLMGLETRTDTLRVRRATNCTRPSLYTFLFYIFIKVSRFSVIIVTLSVVHSKYHMPNVRFTISWLKHKLWSLWFLLSLKKFNTSHTLQ